MRTKTKVEGPNIEQWPIAKITRYENNPRTHSPKQIKQIAASITEWGFTIPMLVDEKGMLLAGHGRLAAAIDLGLKTVPVIVARGWSKAKKAAYVIADNKLADNAGWDRQTLATELATLKDFDIGLIGFTSRELQGFGIGQKTLDASAQLGKLDYSVIIRCDDEEMQTQLLDRFEREGFKCQALIS